MDEKKKMFGFSGFDDSNLPFERFDWKKFSGTSLVCRVVKPKVFSNWYAIHNYHKIMNKYYYHDDGNCEICNILFSDDKYDEAQNKLLKLSIPNKKEKWTAVLQNVKIIEFFAFVEGSKKINQFVFFDPQSTQLLSIILGKGINDDISSLTEGAPIKIIFNNTNVFPYRSVSDVIVGNKAPIFSDSTKLQKLETLLESNDFITTTKINVAAAEALVNEWYNNAISILNKYREPVIRESVLSSNDDLSDILNSTSIFSDKNKNINTDNDSLDLNEDNDDISNDGNEEIPF